MNNKKMLDDILKIRNIRNNIINLSITDKEKETLRKTLNYYEDMLNLDITRINLNVSEFEMENIPNDIEIVDVPIEHNSKRYIEYAKVSENEIINIIDELSKNIDNINLDNKDIIIILKSLKEYSEYLKDLSLVRKNNQELFDEIINEPNKNIV